MKPESLNQPHRPEPAKAPILVPLFESHTLLTLDRAKSTFMGRGQQYGDTWRDCRFLKMAACAKALGYNINPDHFRALATAAFSDMKYWRFLGGFNDDSLIDGINYDAFLAQEMRHVLCQQYAQDRAMALAGQIQNYSPGCDTPGT